MTSQRLIWDVRISQVEAAFEEYIQTPHGRALERLVIDMARRLLLAGRSRYGIAALFEAARYEHALLGKHDDGFRCNNTYRAPMARKIMREHPDLAGFFETRWKGEDRD